MSAWGYGAKGGKDWGAKGGKDWGAKGGKDWGKGSKGADGGKGKDGAKGHELPRTRLSADKFVGTVDAWKGRFGWITPAEEIAHEKAKERNGNLFVAVVDLQGVEALEVGAPVKFHIFEDSQGLGAEEVEQTGPGTPGKGKSAGKGGKDGAKGGWGAPSYAKDGGAKGGWGASSYGKDVGAKGGWGKDGGLGASSWGGKDSWGGKGGKDSWGAPKGVQSGYGKGDYGKSEKGGKSKSGAPKGKGHTLPRTRVTAEKFAGTVSAWKGKYGWITPAEPVAHEKASKNNGSIFVSMDDIQGTELTPGASVAFHIAEDSSGLLAEEVVQS